MKLHLPKALFTSVMAVFALSQTTYAETFNLLESGDNWQMTGRSPLPTYNADTDTIAAGDGWKQSLATYTMPSIEGRHILGYTLTDKVDGVEGSGSLTFQFTCAQTYGESDSILSIALVGSEQVLALGTMAYGTGALGYGVSSDISKDVYHNGVNWENNSRGGVEFTQFTDAGGNAVNRTTGTYTYTGVVTQDANGNYLLDLSVTLLQGESETTTQYLDNYNLGDSFSINRVAFGSDGSNAQLSNLTVTGKYLEVPVYATVLGAGSSSLSSAEWTNNGNGVSYGDIAVTNGADTVVLDITGAAEGSTAQLDAGTNVYAIDISGGLVTLTSSGSVTTKELVVKDGATATIDAELTAGSVSGAVTIAEAGKLAYTGTDMGFLGTTTGTGVISVATATEILQGVVSDFAGTIDVANNQTLYFGSKADSGQDKGTIDLSEATIQLNGGSTLRVQGKQSQLGKLEVLDNATLRMYDGNEVNNAYLTEYTITIGEVSIAADKTLSVEKNWEGHLHIESFNAEGKLDMNHGGQVVVTIESITQSGAIDNAGQTTLGVSGDSVLNLGGDVSNTGTLIIKGQLAGTSTISGGTINVEGTASVTGNITFDSAITVAGTITNSGALTLNGNVSIANLGELDSTGVYSDNGGKDGYMFSVQYIVVSTTGTGTATLGSDDLKLNDTYTLVKDGENIVYNVTADEPTGDYYVNTTVDYTAGSTIAADTTTGITMNGGTLNLNTALAEDISISTAKSGSVINVADGVTLANSSVTAGSTKSTITGGKNAVFDLGTGLNGAMSSVVFNVNYGEQWEGITQITNSHIGENTLDNLCGGGKGTLKLVGLSGWLVRGQTVQADILLENYSNTVDGVTTTKSAFIFDDNSQDNYTFAGDISGSGDFQVASKSGSKADLNFTGSTENWTGGIVVTNAYKYTNDTEKNATNEVTINLTHGGDIFSAKGNKGIVMDRASTNDGNNIVNLNIGNADAASTMNGAISMSDNAGDRAQLKLTVKGDTTFKKKVEVTSLTVDANKTATLEDETTTGTLTTNGTIKVTGNGSLTYGGTTTVAAPYTGYNTEAAAATITSDAITGGTVTFNNAENVTESRVISDAVIFKYGEGTANVTVGDANAAVSVEKGNLAMTAANGSTSLAEMTIAAGSQVSTTGNLTVTEALTIIGDAATPALSVTGALTLAGAEINLTNLTLQAGVTSYTLGTVTTGDIDTTGVSLKFGAGQLAAAGFEGYTATVGASETDATALVLTLTAQTTVDTLTSLTVNGLVGYANGVLTLKTEEEAAGAVFDSQKDVNVTMSDADWDAILAALKVEGTTLPSEIALKFQGSDGEYFDFNGTAVTDDSGMPAITINKEIVRGEYTGPNDGTITGNYVTAYIPEPTTTTLSLLALAGLAVRRRRK